MGGTLKLSQVMQPPYSPTEGMSTMGKLLAGIGQGMTAAGTSAEQIAAHAPWLLAALGNPSALQMPAQAQQAADAKATEAAKTDAPLLAEGSGQVGSILGGAVATAPLMGLGGGASTILGKVAQGAVQGGLGSALATPVAGVRDAQLSDLITGDKGQDFAAEKLKQLGLGAAFGGAGSGVLGAGGKVLEAMLPSNATAMVLNAVGRKANATPFAQEGEALAQQTGVNLTPAQISGSKAGTMAENAARQSILSRDLAFEGDRARIGQLSDYFDKTLNGIRASEASPAVAGAQVQAATRNILKGMEDWRSKTAAEDFGKIRALTKGQAAIQPTETGTLLRSIMEENAGIGTPGGDALANFARKQIQNVSPEARAMAEKLGTPEAAQAAGLTAPAQGNLDKIMQLRSYLSKVAGGQAKISGENQDRRVAAQLLQSIDNDIENAGSQIGGDLGGMLKQANARYREVSQQIENVKASPLGKILGEDMAGALQSGSFNTIAPETVMQRLSSLKPTELGIVKGLLKQDQPEAWSAFKRGILEDALEKAKQMPASEGAATAVMRPNVLIKNLGDARRLQAVFEPNELSQIQAGLDVARRLSDKTGYNFSGTAGQNEALGLLNNIKEGGVKAGMSVAGMALGSRALARLMTDSNGRAALMQLQRLPAGSAKARQLTAYISSLLGTQDDPNAQQ